MTMQATLSYGANKTQVTFNAGAFVAPASMQLAIYVNVLAANFYQDLAVRTSIEKLLNHAKAVAKQFEPLVVPIYYSKQIDAGLGSIINDSALASISAGRVGLGMGPNVPLTSSEQVDTFFKLIRDRMWDQERIFA